MRETALFLMCLFSGVLLLPIAIYLVGQNIFGDYGGAGFAEFYGDLHSQVRNGELVVWFLILSPYLLWQSLRVTFALFRLLGQRP